MDSFLAAILVDRDPILQNIRIANDGARSRRDRDLALKSALELLCQGLGTLSMRQFRDSLRRMDLTACAPTSADWRSDLHACRLMGAALDSSLDWPPPAAEQELVWLYKHTYELVGEVTSRYGLAPGSGRI